MRSARGYFRQNERLNPLQSFQFADPWPRNPAPKCRADPERGHPGCGCRQGDRGFSHCHAVCRRDQRSAGRRAGQDDGHPAGQAWEGGPDRFAKAKHECPTGGLQGGRVQSGRSRYHNGHACPVPPQKPQPKPMKPMKTASSPRCTGANHRATRGAVHVLTVTIWGRSGAAIAMGGKQPPPV